ncbi:hypothetical protein LCGC14_1893250 [marine sediment metagenome]|uniref:Uncharacterized protein n=1 Tax=marine sediment metagenome TaxID=412755 RepID=A0A0F9IWW5_9ZZZZ
MRDEPKNKGRCPIEDDGPVLFSSNQIAVDIFQECRPSAKQVGAEDKTYFYLHPADIEALFRVHAIPLDEQPRLLSKVFLLQDEANRRSPQRPRKPAKSRSRRLR